MPNPIRETEPIRPSCMTRRLDVLRCVVIGAGAVVALPQFLETSILGLLIPSIFIVLAGLTGVHVAHQGLVQGAIPVTTGDVIIEPERYRSVLPYVAIALTVAVLTLLERTAAVVIVPFLLAWFTLRASELIYLQRWASTRRLRVLKNKDEGNGLFLSPDLR